jgi:hypothetical protein
MDLEHSFIYNAANEAGLPTEGQLRASFQSVLDMVLALRAAPLVEPYTGPAILLNRASGVFFHEIFGHRIEGHRQKDVEEGQTLHQNGWQTCFAILFERERRSHAGSLRAGRLARLYRYDDEAVPASRVNLVENGVLRTFLLSRSARRGLCHFQRARRRQPGRQVVSRQGNLMVHSTKSVPFTQLRQMLVDECKKQNKPYGYLFEDITGGFTTTSRAGRRRSKCCPWWFTAFTPMAGPTNWCGAWISSAPRWPVSRKSSRPATTPRSLMARAAPNRGGVPVSAISPSILVEQIEIEKRERSQDRLPILPPPTAVDKGS